MLRAVFHLRVAGRCSRWLPQHRAICVCTAACQKASVVSDPIQQLFLDKIREYSSKSRAAGGKMVGVVPELENEMKDELLRVDNVYKCAGKDMTQFPTFHLSDVALDVPGLGEYKVPEYVEEVDEVHPDDVLDFDPNLPYIMTPLKDKM